MKLQDGCLTKVNYLKFIASIVVDQMYLNIYKVKLMNYSKKQFRT